MLAVEGRPYPPSAPHLRCPRPGPGLFFPFARKAVLEVSGLERSEAPSARFLINVFQQGSLKVEGTTPLKASRAGCI